MQKWELHSPKENIKYVSSMKHETNYYVAHIFYKPLSQCIKITPTTNPHKLIP